MSIPIIRQIFLDTETTGLNQIGKYYEGHKIIEIGAVEVVNRRLTNNNFHVYLKPNRLVDPEAFNIHGISNDFLSDKPVFAEIVDEFISYVSGAELVMHNASFDIGFIDYELSNINKDISNISKFCKISDSLTIARKMFPGKHNSLDKLCSRYGISRNRRILHGALLDAQILAEVYLAMTRGQISISLDIESYHRQQGSALIARNTTAKKVNKFPVLRANNDEIAEHESILDLIQNKNNDYCLWRT